MTLFKELLKKIRNIALNELDKRFVRKHRGYEINKAKDDRREQIRKTIALSEQDIKNIDGLYGISYGEKIPYDWHLLYTAYTGNFDVNYFPELLYIPEFEHFENPYSNYQVVYEDKNVLSLIARGLGVGIPRTICSRMAGMYRDDNYCQCDLKDVVNAIRVLGEVFVKPTIESGSGRGCTVLQVGGGMTDSYIIDILEKLGDDFVVQERLHCHESLSKIYSDSVNTFRIITYRWNKNGKSVIYHMPAVLRIGSGGNYLDNAHAGGMFIAVEDDGTLHKAAFTEFRDVYYSHPDSGVIFEGYKIELFPDVIKCAERCAAALAHVGCINWDFTINESGEVVLIEANCFGGGVWLPQMAHGKGPFADNTADVLAWIAHMKELDVEHRKPFYYGQKK